MCSTMFMDVTAQNVAINATGNAPNASAMIDIAATNKGLLIPRVTYCHRVTPACANGMLDVGGLLPAAAQGLLVYQTDAGTEGQGFYYNTSATTTPTWVKLFAGTGAGGIYAGSGSLSTDPTTVTMGANNLAFTSTVIDGFSVDGTTFSVDALNDRIGIGSTSPAEKLHVTGDFRVSTGQINSDVANLGLMQGVRANDAAYEWIGFYSGTTRQGIILYDGPWSGANNVSNEFSITAENNNHLTLNAGTNEHILIMPKGTGKVGIGTMGPTEKLHVEGGDVKINATSAQGYPDLILSGVGTQVNLRNDGARLWLHSNAAADMRVNIGTNYSNDLGLSLLYTPGTIGAGAGVFQIGQTQKNAATFTHGITELFTNGLERMRIDASGNVGIANTGPTEKLDVTGNIRASGTAYWGSSGTRTETKNDAGAAGGRSGYYQTSAPAPAANWPAGASTWWHLMEARHSNLGNNYSMQIAGSFYDQDFWVRKTNNVASAAWAKLITTANVSSYGDNLGNHTATTTLNMNSNDIDMVVGQSTRIHSLGEISFDWTTGGTYDSPANHGIQSKNEAGAWSDNIRINSYNEIINTLDANSNNATSYFKVQHHSTVNGTDLFWVRSADGYGYLLGNFGIGTTSPTSKLHVSGGTGSVDVLIEADNDNVGEADQPSITLSQDGAAVIGKLGYFGSTNQLTLKNVYNDALKLGTNNADRLTITGVGDVGIGTTAPSSKLEVNGRVESSRLGYVGTYSSTQVQGIWSIGSAYGISTGANDFGTQYGIAYAHTNAGTTGSKKPIAGWGHQILFTTSGTRNAAISLSSGHAYFAGNVGIGTTAPSTKLHVAGQVKITGGTPAAGQVLTSDASGLATWEPPGAPTLNQGMTRVIASNEVRLIGNNSGSYSNCNGCGYSVGTWLNVTNMSVARTITAGNFVQVNFSGRIETDDFNYYAPEQIFFRILRNGAEIARTAVSSRDPQWYFTDNNVSLTLYDSGAASGSNTYSVQCHMVNGQSGTESFYIGERYLTITEIKP